ncbi:MAG: hypothetical protein IIX84_04880, partial [Oscillospiraceae bacterium]|nr:hypothetical protein [Oscillospiraceae bacterium]
AITHLGWRSVDKNGKFILNGAVDDHCAPDAPMGEYSWHNLCLNDGGEYAEHIYALAEEVCQRYSVVDGLFFDICIVNDACYCENCKRGMREMGIDISNDAEVRRYFVLKRRAFMEKCSAILKKYHPDATIFFNSGGADQYKPEYHAVQSHYEMEDLPTCWGGYDKLPVRAKFFANKNKPYIGMTGKFHLSWGEFGGFKTKEALKYEVCQMALYGAGASVGDHMHPDGEMEMQTYENIGYAYDYLEKISPFCYGGETIANIGLYCSAREDVNEGVSNILLQHQIDFEIIAENNFSDFDTVIIPEYAFLDDAALEALKEYLANGGKLLAVGDSLVRNGKFAVDMGLEFIGGPEYDCDYIMSDGKYSNVPNAPMLCNLPGFRTKAVGATVFADFITPYFSRTHGKFCGHKNTPHDKNSDKYPAIAKYGNVVYLSHPLASAYHRIGSLYHREYFINALKLVYSGGAYEVEGLGSQGRVTMIRQSEKSRCCMNMTYALPVKRGMAEVIEDIMPVYNIKVKVKVKENIKRVYLGVSGEEIKTGRNGNEVSFTIPELNCHTTVVMEY